MALTLSTIRKGAAPQDEHVSLALDCAVSFAGFVGRPFSAGKAAYIAAGFRRNQFRHAAGRNVTSAAIRLNNKVRYSHSG